MHDYDIEGFVHTDGSWTRFQVVRTTRGYGSIEFDPAVKPGQVLSLRLRNANGGELFTEPVTWGPNETGRKILATNVLAGTRFTIDARGSVGHSRFTGKLFTA